MGRWSTPSCGLEANRNVARAVAFNACKAAFAGAIEPKTMRGNLW
ncbi:hypothetical protein ACFSQT_29420 [Mesorhizobium calcicola]|uniref:Transposase n=1 Tax=Mesorhizobium calcicola TaxID=1300310 RepID=A0ABW4WKG6_9HYPH